MPAAPKAADTGEAEVVVVVPTPKVYVASAAQVVVRNSNGKTSYLFSGSIVPDGTTPDCIEHLHALGLITELGK